MWFIWTDRSIDPGFSYRFSKKKRSCMKNFQEHFSQNMFQNWKIDSLVGSNEEECSRKWISIENQAHYRLSICLRYRLSFLHDIWIFFCPRSCAGFLSKPYKTLAGNDTGRTKERNLFAFYVRQFFYFLCFLLEFNQLLSAKRKRAIDWHPLS